MKNIKGFTLIELIITITVIAIIMLTAVPNIASMNDKNKRTNYIQDAKKLVKLAKYQFTQTTSGHPSSSSCIKYNIKVLDQTELQTPPNGGSYLADYSYVEVKYEGSEYKYYVQLVEEFTVSGKNYYRGVKLVESDSLEKENAKIQYVKQAQKSNFNSYENSSCSSAKNVTISDAERPGWKIEEVKSLTGVNIIRPTTGVNISIRATKVVDISLNPDDINVYINNEVEEPYTKSVSKTNAYSNGDQIWTIYLNNFSKSGWLFISIKENTYKDNKEVMSKGLPITPVCITNRSCIKIE